MPEEDPVIKALSTVEHGPDHDAEPDALDDAEPESRAHSSDVEARGAGVDDPLAADAEEESGFSVRSWAKRIPDGSHRDFDRTDWFDLEGGGENRIVFHLSDAIGDHGEGPYPNALGSLVGAFELYVRLAKGKIDTPTLGVSDSSDGSDADNAETGGMY